MSQAFPVFLLLIIILMTLGALRLSGFGRFGDELSHLLQESKRMTVALLLLGARRMPRFQGTQGALSQLLRELKRHMPVYSAETVDGKEAEFIRDDLPKPFPFALVVVALLLFGAVAWWLRS
jgi:hypothetical protein